MNTIITIARQFGSGGREIGEKLANHYGIPYYDKNVLARVAKESGFCEEFLDTQDERPTNSFLYNLVMDAYAFGSSGLGIADMPISQKVFLAQFNTIKKIAAEGPCVIIGRCADCALEDRDDTLSLFIHADEEFRLQRLDTVERQRRDDIPESRDKMREFLEQTDKQRQSYYNYYSMKKWGRSDTYDMTINSGLFGIDNTVEMLIDVIARFEARKK